MIESANLLIGLIAFAGIGLVGGLVSLRFALAAGVELDDDTDPFSQRDTMPCSAPATPRASELGAEFGVDPAEAGTGEVWGGAGPRG